MSYESYETPQFSVDIFYYDKEYSNEVPKKVLPILTEHGFYPPKSMNACINLLVNGKLKTKKLFPDTKDMSSQVAKDFFLKCYSEEGIMGISLSNVDKRSQRNNDLWSLNWNFTFYKAPKLLVVEPLVIPENILTITSTYDRLENMDNLNNFFAVVKKIIKLLNPYYACIEDISTSVDVMDKTKEKSFTEDYLQSIYWGNYFGEKLCKDLGMDKLNNLPVKNKEMLGNGFFFTLSDDILDSRFNPDFKQRKKIYKYLNPSLKNHMAF